MATLDNLSRRSLCNLVLHHILTHDLVIKLERALLGHIIIDFSLFGLDHVSALWIDSVSDAVVLKVDLTALSLVVEQVLVVPGCLLLVHQAASWRRVLLLIVVIEFAHDFIELIHVESVLASDAGVPPRLGQKRIELRLHGGYLVLELLVVEHIGCALHSCISLLSHGQPLTTVHVGSAASGWRGVLVHRLSQLHIITLLHDVSWVLRLLCCAFERTRVTLSHFRWTDPGVESIR